MRRESTQTVAELSKLAHKHYLRAECAEATEAQLRVIEEIRDQLGNAHPLVGQVRVPQRGGYKLWHVRQDDRAMWSLLVLRVKTNTQYYTSLHNVPTQRVIWFGRCWAIHTRVSGWCCSVRISETCTVMKQNMSKPSEREPPVHV